MALAERGDKNIIAAVVVVISDGYAQAVHFDSQAGLTGDVGERSVAIVAVERHGGMRAGMTGPILSIDQQDVLPAVIVIVQKSDARAQCFRQPHLAERAIVGNEMNACGARDILKSDMSRRWRQFLRAQAGERQRQKENCECGPESWERMVGHQRRPFVLSRVLCEYGEFADASGAEVSS